MNSLTIALLDQAELLQLSRNASDEGDDASAIAYLKESVSRSDSSGLAHFLLGAHYAQIKMYDRAVASMESALALAPSLSIARFQLGLLWLTSGMTDKAALVFAPLAELPNTDCLRYFGSGLRHLIDERLEEAEHDLQAGIGLNTSNAALNVDMQRILDELTRLRDRIADEGSVSNATDTVASAVSVPSNPLESGHHVLLSIYGSNPSR